MELTETPELPTEPSITVTSFRPLEGSKMSFPGNPRFAPPDLTQSVEEAYRSFLSGLAGSSGSRTTGNSISLLTPKSEINQFSFSGSGEAARVESSAGDDLVMKGAAATSSTVQLGEYAAHATRRFAELGYMQPPRPPNEAERRRAVRR
jgi:hypothetical protein